MESKTKTCVNGHNYDALLNECPYCPPEDMKTYMPGNNDSRQSNYQTSPNAFSANEEKTIVDTSAPTIKPSSQNSVFDNDKTVISSPNAGPSIVPTNAPAANKRKLVGWLVTFDLDDAGIDYKLYEGRNRIGRKIENDVALNAQGVSDVHALLLYRNNKFTIADQLSTNGTFVNGEMVEDKCDLTDNDIIKIGNITLKIKVIN